MGFSRGIPEVGGDCPPRYCHTLYAAVTVSKPIVKSSLPGLVFSLWFIMSNGRCYAPVSPDTTFLGDPAENCFILSIVVSRMRSIASVVLKARCGVTITRGSLM